MKLFGAQNRQNSQNIGKALPREGCRIAISRSEKPNRTNGNNFSTSRESLSENVRKPRSNEGNLGQKRKRTSETDRHYYLEKVFVSRFGEVKKSYKTNRKSTFPEAEKRYQKIV